MRLCDKLSSPSKGILTIGRAGFNYSGPRYKTDHLATIPHTAGKLAFKKLKFRRKNAVCEYKTSKLIELAENPYMRVVVQVIDLAKNLDEDSDVEPVVLGNWNLQMLTKDYVSHELDKLTTEAQHICGNSWFLHPVVTTDDVRQLYLGMPEDAWVLHRHELGPFFSTFGRGKPANVAYDPHNEQYIGWSHRAMQSFGVGDKLFREQEGDSQTSFKEHGRHTCQTLDDAFLAACNFANYVG